MLLGRQQRRAERQFVDLLPATIDTAIRMLRAGLPITSCMRFIGDNAEAPVNAVFAMIADQAEIGVPVEEALDAESQKVGLPDFRFFAVTVVLQRATGGNLASTLEILSDIMRKRHMLRQKTKAASAEIRMSAYVLGALPFVCVGLMLLLRPEYFAPLIQDPRGQVILAMACGSLLLALVTMQLMIRRVASA
jgi:tight adherence protein B